MPEKSVVDIIRELESMCKDGNYIFRGTNHEYSKIKNSEYDGVSSSLYRTYIDQVGKDKRTPFTAIEQTIISTARRHFQGAAKDEEILTDIRHYDGDASLIDFTTNLYVALFFACYEKYDPDHKNNRYGKNGEIVLLKCDNTIQTDNIYNRDEQKTKIGEKEIKIIDPAITQSSRTRVIAQHSIFVHAPEGYIDRGKYETYSIEANRKEDLLEYLRKFHGIHAAAMYNDMQGFIKNELVSHQHAAFEFIRATRHLNKKEYTKAIKHLDTSIKLYPNHASTYSLRGSTHHDLKNYKQAISDYSKVIELNPNNSTAYYNRGVAYSAHGEHMNAFDDYNRVIAINSRNSLAYYGRGVSLSNQGKHREAIADFITAKNLESKSTKNPTRERNDSLIQHYQVIIRWCNKAKNAVLDLTEQADTIITFCQSRLRELEAE